MNLDGYLILPGLVNAHDHLEFALFPVLNRRLYRNAREWAEDVYRPDESPVREHRAVDRGLRLWFGAVRNLLCGVTTVWHHNPWEQCFSDPAFPIRVKRTEWAHSLDFEPSLVDRFRSADPNLPFVIHAAEGVDEHARSEISRLDALGVLTPRTVLVHAFGLAAGDVEIIRARGCRIVWCPCSNMSTYGATLNKEVLESGIPIALGSDSPITSATTFLDDIRFAERAGMDRERIYEMVTRDSDPGDFVAVRDRGQRPCDAIFDLQPELVAVNGQVRLASEAFREEYPHLSPILVNGGRRYLV